MPTYVLDHDMQSILKHDFYVAEKVTAVNLLGCRTFTGQKK